MAVTLKTAKPRMFSTYIDVIREIEHLKTQNIDLRGDIAQDPIKHTGQIEEAIIKADGYIIDSLRTYYTEANMRKTTPWITPPMSDPKNIGDMSLISVGVGAGIADAYTAGWIAEFTSATEFKLTSSLEGAQGTGLAFASDQSSTNTDITIGSNQWVVNSKAVNKEDKYYFSVIDAHTTIWSLSVRFAIVGVENSIFTSESPNENANVEKLRRDGRSILRSLKRPHDKDGIRLESFSERSLASTNVYYEIDDLGRNKSSYLLDS